MSPTNLGRGQQLPLKLMAIITANPNTGSILTVSASNPAWSSMSLTEESYTISGGIMQKSKLSGLLKAKTEVLEDIVKAFKLQAGQEFPMPVTLVVSESHTPFWAGQSPKINPSTSEIFLKNGKEVYRKTDVIMGKTNETYVFVGESAPVAVPAKEAIEAFENAGANL